ncbi:hypothetical protein [Nonomuraea salmonea]|uniref:hypothetical protein n=1 Tax=Nonomuraea salmonea TaxID=46181 RepID=UPI003CD09010
MRALCVDHPDDPVAWQADLEYLLGRDLLVAPHDRAGRRQAGLPAAWPVGGLLDGRGAGGRPLRPDRQAARPDPALRPLRRAHPGPGGRGHGGRAARDHAGRLRGGGDGTVHIHDADGLTVAVATRDGDELRVAVTGPKRVTGVDIVPVAGAPARAVIS